MKKCGGCAGSRGFGVRLVTPAMLPSVVLMKRRKSNSDIDVLTANASSTISRVEFLRATINPFKCEFCACTLWGYEYKTVNHGRKEYARDDDGDGFCEVYVNTMEGFWSLLRSWHRPHRGISQEKLPLYLALFQFVHNTRKRGKALLNSLVERLLA